MFCYRGTTVPLGRFLEGFLLSEGYRITSTIPYLVAGGSRTWVSVCSFREFETMHFGTRKFESVKKWDQEIWVHEKMGPGNFIQCNYEAVKFGSAKCSFILDFLLYIELYKLQNFYTICVRLFVNTAPETIFTKSS